MKPQKRQNTNFALSRKARCVPYEDGLLFVGRVACGGSGAG
eukprot:CAMPEP_0201659798 /NCGR_PEP_ID=MMETSP0494-20130426/2567_1 /ASSEMBLY_ACC=CAM_ASM_000839 /TAXON_ID=420259 /ORGANISM="Thalassiosira gravida, Strain GMp14c1" /LENGTH=40 /DNA_ID= /DNA_START= /DNA_END= /DNA_ORIENTATION=